MRKRRFSEEQIIGLLKEGKRSMNPVLWSGLPSLRFSGERSGGRDVGQTGSRRA